MDSEAQDPAIITDPSAAEALLQEDAENWQHLQALYHLAESTPVEGRERALEAAGADEPMRLRVLSLLSAAEEFEALPAPAPEVAPLGGRVGAYALLRHLGSGGLGSVYLSERIVGGAIQKCAVKVLSMRSDELSFRARFQREQQILASLDHPHITRLLDAGLSESNQPYLVMEFVDGVDLTAFCDQRRLGIAARIALFLSICDAITYAHRNLIVHLDLKPSNILVSSDGTVKVLDFGTSKLIDPEGEMTTTVFATPAYASPEQLRGDPVTTACDTYSLGAILYELLTGQRPFPGTSVAMAISRAAREQDPPPITAAVTLAGAEARGAQGMRLRQMLRGDLAAIVSRCLRSRPQDRYASVDALAADLARHLEGRPVSARRQTFSYRLAKFARRNRAAVVTGTAVVLLLALAATYSYRREQQALRQGRRAEQMQTFLTELFKLANQNYTGKPDATVPEFLQLGVRVLPDMIKDPADRRAAELSLGESMYNSRDLTHALPVLQQTAADARAAGDAEVEAEADAFGGLAALTLGQTKLSRDMTDRALSLAHARGVGTPARVWAEGSYALSRAIQGVDLARNVSLLQTAAKESRSPEVPDRERLWILEKLALLDQTRGDLASASQLAGEAYAVVQREPYALCDRSVILELQANLLSVAGNDAKSLPVYRSAVAAAAACSGPDSDNTLVIEDLLARAMMNAGQTKEAIALLESILPAWRKASGGGQALSTPLTFLARAYVMDGRAEKAEATAREALQIQEGKVNPNSTRVAICHLILAQALSAEHRDKPALAEAELTEKTYTQIPGMSPIEKSYQAQAHALLLDLQAKTGPRSPATPVVPRAAK